MAGHVSKARVPESRVQRRALGEVLHEGDVVVGVGDDVGVLEVVHGGRAQLAANAKGATPLGTFRVRSKLRTATMDNLEHTDVVPYAYEDVPFVQYFTERAALHAALWHARFGHVASHGCINLSPSDAERLFAFTEPRLTSGPAVSAPGDSGTVIRVRQGRVRTTFADQP